MLGVSKGGEMDTLRETPGGSQDVVVAFDLIEYLAAIFKLQ